MFDTDPDQMQRRVSEWAQGFADKAKQFQAMRAQVEQIQITESSPGGAVRVTVDSTGALTDLALTDKICDLRPAEVAAQVMACLRRAQQQLAPRVQEAMQATVGDDRLVTGVLSGYRERFGEDLSRHSAGADPEVLGLGVIEDDSVPRHRPAPARRPAHAAPPPDDDEYFADRGYLS
ncbi:MAG: YbaB/EbfC family nucleoid-associated protein [Pseudonocardiaceae bacterium]